ncbi:MULTISPECIES: sulfatase [Nocardioides]|uniref:Sulfatase n=1 Tax=Nocardioides vastitatis TaxID=2568655 RepID=A0ABW0ZL54_9ACTN|nr:sulfatase [Nocardioides sp.]THJ08154.1 sulfatase [Nocardioides sp.]
MRISVVRGSLVVLGVGLILAMVLALLLGSTSGGSDARTDLAQSAPTTTVPPAPEPVEPSKAVELPARPNVVVVMADDMRVDDLAFAPNLRSLVAEQGVTFENSFSPYPLCCPARASFLTGQYAHNHKVLWHDPPFGYGSFDDSRTLATSLQNAGYRTGFIGKYLNRYGLDRSKVTGEPSHSYVPNGWTDWRGAVENPGGAGFHGQTYDYFDTPFNVNGVIDNRYAGVYQSAVIGDFSVDMARSFAGTADPFFMYVNYVAPHHGEPGEPDDPDGITHADGTPVRVPTPARPDWVKGRYDDLIDRPSGVARTGEMVEYDVTDKPPSVQRRARALAEDALIALRDATRQRAESIHVMDLHIARLVKELKRSGEWDETVFAFTSDNGMIIGEHGLTMTKVRAYEPSLRVPLLITGPGLREEQKRYDPVSTVDLAATILDLADADTPYPGDGVSRLDSLVTGDRGWTTPIVTEALHTSDGGDDPAFRDRRSTIGIRVSQYSYTRYRDGTGELYDLVADPRQDQNVYASAEYAAVRAALDRLWTRVRSCRAASCVPSLPGRLAADAGQNEANTVAYWEEILGAYGWHD